MYINFPGRSKPEGEWPSTRPAPEYLDLEEFYAERCTIYGKEIDGIVCGFGIGIYALFWIFFIVAGFYATWKFIASRLERKHSGIPDLKARLAKYSHIPYFSLPGCLRLHISDSIGSERFQTWKSLASIHGVPLLPQKARETLAEVSDVTLSTISEQKGVAFDLKSLLMNLQDLHREDTTLRIVTHLDRCLTCTVSLSEYVTRDSDAKSLERARLPTCNSYTQHRDSLTSINTASSVYYAGETDEKLMNACLDKRESPLTAAETQFWSEFGTSRIADDRRVCIMKILYQEFELGNCRLLKDFRSLRRWPTGNRDFRAILERRSPAEEYFNCFLNRKPDYTYQKLKEDLEKIEHYSLLQGIADHYNAGSCFHCFPSSWYEDETDKFVRRRISAAVEINPSDNVDYAADHNTAHSRADSGITSLPTAMWNALASKNQVDSSHQEDESSDPEYAGDTSRNFEDITAMPAANV